MFIYVCINTYIYIYIHPLAVAIMVGNIDRYWIAIVCQLIVNQPVHIRRRVGNPGMVPTGFATAPPGATQPPYVMR